MRFSRFNPASLRVLPAILAVAGAPALAAAEPDARIEDAIRGSYNFTTYLKEEPIKVQCTDGVVRLSGSVAEEYHRFLAEHTAQGVAGVKRVDNQITVMGRQPASGSDDWVTMKVKSTLAFHRHVSASGTNVQTSNGVVTLTGTVDSAAEKALTAEYAKDVDGVKEVINNLTVGKEASSRESLGRTIDDTSITAQIKTSLLFHKSVRSLATKIITKAGRVSIHGQAKTEAERALVGRIAAGIKGVRHVSNHMTVAKS